MSRHGVQMITKQCTIDSWVISSTMLHDSYNQLVLARPFSVGWFHRIPGISDDVDECNVSNRCCFCSFFSVVTEPFEDKYDNKYDNCWCAEAVIVTIIVLLVVVESRRVEVAVIAAAVAVAAPATLVVVLVEFCPQPGVRDLNKLLYFIETRERLLRRPMPWVGQYEVLNLIRNTWILYNIKSLSVSSRLPS